MTKETTTREGPAYIPTLDGWRAVAVLAVVVCHGAAYPFSEHGPASSEVLYHATRLGAYGVDLFFAISGFLIGGKLLDELTVSGSVSLRRFYLRRFFRIMPSYWIYLGTLALLTAFGWPLLKWQEAVSCLVYLRNYLPSHTEFEAGFTGHLWSLAVEEHFYLIMPPLLLLGRRLPAKSWLFAFAALAGLVAGWRVLAFRLPLLAAAGTGISFFERTDIRADGLFWGVALAAGCQVPALRQKLVALSRPPFAAVWAAVFLAVIWFDPPLRHVWVALLAPLLLASTVLHPGAWGPFFEAKVARYIGKRSYSLYLWQSLFLVGPEIARPLPFGTLQALPWCLLATWLCAEVSYRYVEKPLIKLGHRLTPPRVAEGAPPAAEPHRLAKLG